MKIRLITTLALLALIAALAGTSQATVLTFDGGQGANADVPFTYGSNKGVADDGAEFITLGPSGATPNIALAWGPNPSTNVLEFHSSSNWIAPMSGNKVQFDVDLSSQTAFPDAPTIDFVPDAGFKVIINSLLIGTALDQHIADGHEPASDWEITVTGDQGTAFTYTTTALGQATQGSGAVELVNINVTGLIGETLTLLFNDFGDDSLLTNHDGTIGNHPRGGIDNLSFSQMVPEPSSLVLVALCGLSFVSKRRRS